MKNILCPSFETDKNRLNGTIIATYPATSVIIEIKTPFNISFLFITKSPFSFCNVCFFVYICIVKQRRFNYNRADGKSHNFGTYDTKVL